MKKKIDLVILAGDKNKSIKKELKGMPKSMARFNNLYFLDYLINHFSKYNFENIYILVGYKSNIIINRYHNKQKKFSKIICVKEKKELGTAGALYGLRKVTRNFILVNGDTIFDVNLKKLINAHKKKYYGVMSLTNNKLYNNNKKLSNLSFNNNIVTINKKSNYMNGGVYFFNNKIFSFINNKKNSLKNEVLPALIKKQKILSNYSNNFFLDIGSLKNFSSTEKKLKEYFNRPAVFLDRDGVINYDKGYIHKFKDFRLRKGVIKGLKYLVKKKYYIFIVTNQAGIAKNKFTINDFIIFQKKIEDKLQKLNIYFDDVKFCPYHPNGTNLKYKKNSQLRKPNNLMIKQLLNEWLINKSKSFMIGDKISDKLCADKSNIHFEYSKSNFYKQVHKLISRLNTITPTKDF